MTKSNEVATDIAMLLRARNPLMWVISSEEVRVESHLFKAILAAKYTIRTWDVAQGIAVGANGKGDPETKSPDIMLEKISEASKKTSGMEKGVWILRDLPTWLGGPANASTLRQLRNLARDLPKTQLEAAQAIIILSPDGNVPPELSGHATVIKWPIPDRAEIAALLTDAIEPLGTDDKARALAALKTTRDAAIDAAVGLTGEEAQACYAKSLVQYRRIDPAAVSREKRRVIARERVLEWYDPIPGGLDAIGGLGRLKEWLIQRKLAYTPAAREYGLPAPKGIMLVGVSGCLHGDTPLYDPIDGTTLTVKTRHVLGKSFRVWSQHEGTPVIGLALPPVEYEEEEMIEFEFDSGEKITVTPGHMFINKGKIIFASEVFERLQGCEPFLLETSSESSLSEYTADVLRSTRIAQGFLDDCLLDPTPPHYGEQLHSAKDIAPTFVPSLTDVHERRQDYSHMGDLAYESLRSLPYPIDAPPSKQGSSPSIADQGSAGYQLLQEPKTLFPEKFQAFQQSGADNIVQFDTTQLLFASSQESTVASSSTHQHSALPRKYLRVKSARKLAPSTYYDFHVPGYENYWACGVWNHNCGKSLTAKAISTAWGIPLLKIDLGALKSKFVGDSENNLRKAFEVIAAIGRCVVWFDEIEKALAGAINGGADGGVSADALGAILTWMQERRGEAFVIATANDITGLPPEFLRKGRFDEIFFVDLPNTTERIEVLKTALKTYKRDQAKINLRKVADISEGFTGAEIAELVPDALFRAFSDGGREITTGDITASAENVVPLSKTAEIKIKALREWAKGKAQPATAPEAITTTKQHRILDLEEN